MKRARALPRFSVGSRSARVKPARLLLLGLVAAACQNGVGSDGGSTKQAQRPVAPYDTLPSGAVTDTCVVGSISDGDTFRCGDGTRIRLLTVDAPEMTQGAFGSLAKQTLAELLPVGTTVTLEFDVQRLDVYGRTLAYVRKPGVLVNRVLVRRGVAVVAVYPPNVRYVEVLRAAGDSARAEKRGLWATNGFECLPADHRAERC